MGSVFSLEAVLVSSKEKQDNVCFFSFFFLSIWNKKGTMIVSVSQSRLS